MLNIDLIFYLKILSDNKSVFKSVWNRFSLVSEIQHNNNTVCVPAVYYERCVQHTSPKCLCSGWKFTCENQNWFSSQHHGLTGNVYLFGLDWVRTTLWADSCFQAWCNITECCVVRQNTHENWEFIALLLSVGKFCNHFCNDICYFHKITIRIEFSTLSCQLGQLCILSTPRQQNTYLARNYVPAQNVPPVDTLRQSHFTPYLATEISRIW